MTRPELPTVASVVTAFRQELEHPGRERAGLLGTLIGLHANNLAQWKLEDAARERLATDSDVATAKRGIDRLNLARHEFVEEIDRAISEVLAPPSSAPLATESPAMAFDRLSVLIIRLHQTEIATRSPGADSGLLAARLPALRGQVASLEAALTQLLREVEDGKRSFVPYRHLKLYGAPSEPAT
jgi:hypothetical protein